jgi:hypothetical protein
MIHLLQCCTCGMVWSLANAIQQMMYYCTCSVQPATPVPVVSGLPATYSLCYPATLRSRLFLGEVVGASMNRKMIIFTV